MYIKNKGSDTMVVVAQAWAEAYKRVDGGVGVGVSGGGSGTGDEGLCFFLMVFFLTGDDPADALEPFLRFRFLRTRRPFLGAAAA